MSLKRLAEDSGAVAVLVAASIFLLMGFAALAVDWGGATNERRLDQLTADSSVMGGGVTMLISSSSDPFGDSADDISYLVDQNLNRTVSDSDWEKCEDAGAYSIQPGITDASGTGTVATPCISFSTADEEIKIRVRVPEQQYDTYFGGFVGLGTINVDAFAEATIESAFAVDVLPLGLFSGAGTGTEQCLKEDTPGNGGDPLPAPCDTGGQTGNFGPLRPYTHSFDTSNAYCTNTKGVFVWSLANGVDHLLSWFDDPDYLGPGDTREREDACIGPSNDTPVPLANTMPSGVGLAPDDLEGGLLIGSSYQGLPQRDGRLMVDNDMGQSIKNTFVENTPLWAHLLNGKCTSVLRNPTQAQLAQNKIALIACLESWMPNGVGENRGQLFDTSIVGHQRLAFVPIYSEDDSVLPGASQPYHFNDFIPVYLQQLWIKEAGGGGNVSHDPGQTGPNIGINNGAQIRALTSIVLDCQMVPSVVCENTQGGGTFVTKYAKLLMSR